MTWTSLLGKGLDVNQVLSAAGVNLQTAAYSGSIAPGADYLLGKVEMEFSTSQARSITISCGTVVLWAQTAVTALDVVVDFEGLAFEASEVVTVAITQTAGACAVNVNATAEMGAGSILPPSGLSVLGPGTAHVGSVNVDNILTTLLGVKNNSDLNNSTVVPVWAANAEYDGVFSPASDIGSLFAFVLSFVPFSTVTPPVIQWSTNGTTVDTFAGSPVTTAMPVHTIISGGITYYYSLVVVNPPFIRGAYYNIKAVNGASPGTFYALAGVGNAPGVGTVKALADSLSQLSVAQLVQAVISGYKPDGSFGIVNLSPQNDLSVDLQSSFAETLAGDEASAVYISQDQFQFDVPFVNNNVTITQAGGGTTVQSAANGAVLTSDNSAGTSQSNIHGTKVIRYASDRENRMAFSAHFLGTPIVGTNAVVGLSDTPLAPLTGNGLLLGSVDTVFGFHIVSAGVVTTIPRVNVADPTNQWNGDPADGSQYSQFTSGGLPVALDVTKTRAWRLRYLWFGVGPVALEARCPDGDWVRLHTFRYSGTAIVPYLQNPNMYPVWDVSKTAGAAIGTLTIGSFSATAGTMDNELNYYRHEVHGNKLVNSATSGQAVVAGTPQPIYTVSAGRQLLVSAINFTASIGTANARLEFHDDTGTGTGPLRFALQGGQANSLSQLPAQFDDPLQFLNGVTLVSTTGTITASGGISGVEKSL